MPQVLKEIWSGDSGLAQIALAIAAIALVALIAYIAYRSVFSHRLRVPGGRTRQPRLGVVDAFSVDGQRQLVLIRRDNVEHLIMIGGPNDVVVESEIVRMAASAPPPPPVPVAAPPPAPPRPRPLPLRPSRLWRRQSFRRSGLRPNPPRRLPLRRRTFRTPRPRRVEPTIVAPCRAAASSNADAYSSAPAPAYACARPGARRSDASGRAGAAHAACPPAIATTDKTNRAPSIESHKWSNQ